MFGLWISLKVHGLQIGKSGVVGGVFPSEWPPLPAHHLLHLQKRQTAKKIPQQSSKRWMRKSSQAQRPLMRWCRPRWRNSRRAVISLITALVVRQAHFPRNFLIPTKFPVSWKDPFAVEKLAEMRKTSVGKFFPTEIGQGIPCLQTPYFSNFPEEFSEIFSERAAFSHDPASKAHSAFILYT